MDVVKGMAVRSIVLYGDPVLRKKAQPIVSVDQGVKDLVADLIATLTDAQGLGLAANQIGVARRVFLVDLSPLEPDEKMRVFINPEILETSGEFDYEEGCLSFPGIYERIVRPQYVRVRAIDETGNEFEMEADGVLARVILHENDHLDGKLFVDYLSPMVRSLISGKLKKLKTAEIG